MVGASFAAVPFYNWFCRTTGYGGTTQRAHAAPAQITGRTITVHFDSNVAAGLPWAFEPERRTIDVKLGEVVTVYYKVINEAARVTSVRPPTTSIRRRPASISRRSTASALPSRRSSRARSATWQWCSMSIPSSPADSEQDGTNMITLSYTFYPVKEPEQPVAASAPSLPSPQAGEDKVEQSGRI